MKIPIRLSTGLFIFSLSAMADETIHIPPAYVTWVSPENYRDIRTTGGSQKRFQSNLFQRLSEHFSEMARVYLKPEQTLRIQVTNLDLAGDTRHSSNTGQEIRVLTSITPPAISFNYQIKQDGKALKSDSVRLTDLNYQSSVLGGSGSRALVYEKQLIHDWARKTLRK
ncbi:DUF3016 domain-containing protein [uncultured Photobacterium sp.]|uniref:DUF3016 domain-containing protein n=1 Tax=uncultured Photobacterium sp. TaxID=173973 RepID=UPI00263607EC|nr:DUF3016 domain-containing protein [uncultured Photobacterium sp.]